MKNIVISLIGLVFGLIITLIFESILKSNKNLKNKYYRHHKILWGYHIHHSAYGLLFIAMGIIYYFIKNLPVSFFSVFSGIGVIIEHTISDGKFIFWEKQK